MMQYFKVFTLALVSLFMVNRSALAWNTEEIESISLFVEKGERSSWSHVQDLIAFDRLTGDYYDVYLIHPDGSGESCLTCQQPDIPGRHVGNVDWHPSAHWIVATVEKDSHYGTSLASHPGWGVNCDLWVIAADGSTAKSVRTVDENKGTLHPHFSPDGTMLLWAEITENDPVTLEDLVNADEQDWREGRVLEGWLSQGWKLKIADFDEESGQLSNIVELDPAGDGLQFYESHDFNPSNPDEILFTGEIEGTQQTGGLDIYRMSRSSGEWHNLTATDSEWDEHAHYTPDGNSIVWITSYQTEGLSGWGSDLWRMNSDGSDPVRLTYFNNQDHPEYPQGGQVQFVMTGDSSFDAAGERLLVYIAIKFAGVPDRITSNVMVDFKPEEVTDGGGDDGSDGGLNQDGGGEEEDGGIADQDAADSEGCGCSVDEEVGSLGFVLLLLFGFSVVIRTKRCVEEKRGNPVRSRHISPRRNKTILRPSSSPP